MTSMISDKSGDINKVVLLGASGRLGEMLRSYWPDAGTLICHSRRPQPEFVSFDPLLKSDKAISTMQNASAVVCLSGVTPAHAVQSGDPLSLNTDLALATVRAAYTAKVARVFLVSSAAVYGKAEGIQTEDALCYPASDYGNAKLDMEHAVLALAAKLGQPVTILRIGNVAGADAILGGWREDMRIDQLPDGSTPSRSYIGPETLTRVIYDLTQASALPEIMNVAAPGVVEMGDLLDAAELSWSPNPAPDGVIPNVTLSTKQLERYTVFASQNSTAAGLVAEWRSFKKHK